LSGPHSAPTSSQVLGTHTACSTSSVGDAGSSTAAPQPALQANSAIHNAMTTTVNFPTCTRISDVFMITRLPCMIVDLFIRETRAFGAPLTRNAAKGASGEGQLGFSGVLPIPARAVHGEAT